MSKTEANYDYLIIGAGIIGVSLARELLNGFPHSNIAVIDKESDFGFHSSGRNSGVLHAGFYYTADSLKAKFSVEGNRYIKEYCKKNNLYLNECGKIVVAKDQEDLDRFPLLLDRAKSNGVRLIEISEEEATELEPNVKTFKKALWSPDTASVNPKEVLNHMVQSLKSQGVRFFLGCKYLKRSSEGIESSDGEIKAKYIINAAGLYADKIARDYGFSKDYSILPFKGVYLYPDKNDQAILKRHIYPVPNLKNPFLGVHHTVNLKGQGKIGPTAIPIFWREQYKGFERFSFSELMQILPSQISLFFSANFNFRGLAVEEMKKYYKPILLQEAAGMVKNMDLNESWHWGPAGIRAQLFNLKKRSLEMDFICEGDRNSYHILNAISPAFTCSKPFSEYLLEDILKLRGLQEAELSI